METNERVINRSADDVILWTQILIILWSRRLAVDISTYIFSTYDSISTCYNIDDTKAAG